MEVGFKWVKNPDVTRFLPSWQEQPQLDRSSQFILIPALKGAPCCLKGWGIFANPRTVAGASFSAFRPWRSLPLRSVEALCTESHVLFGSKLGICHCISNNYKLSRHHLGHCTLMSWRPGWSIVPGVYCTRMLHDKNL